MKFSSEKPSLKNKIQIDNRQKSFYFYKLYFVIL